MPTALRQWQKDIVMKTWRRMLFFTLVVMFRGPKEDWVDRLLSDKTRNLRDVCGGQVRLDLVNSHSCVFFSSSPVFRWNGVGGSSPGSLCRSEGHLG